MYIIQKEGLGKSTYHPIQYQSHRRECWEEHFIAVPEDLEERVARSGGYCHLLIREDSLVDIEELEMPEARAGSVQSEDLEAMVLDQEYRLILLEWGVV